MDAGTEASGICGFCCTGILQQFFSTQTWGSNWKCMDKCCRCDCCWDAGEYDPNNLPGGSQTNAQDKDNLAPPAYQPADPMVVKSPEQEAQARANEATQTTVNQDRIPMPMMSHAAMT